jgi:hypothetical protein
MESSRVVSAASRPLPLYYALSQGGRAIAAAHGQQWNLHGHGLKLGPVEDDLLAMAVQPHGKGEFQAVSDITGSHILEQPVQIGALWASLPELVETVPDDERWPLALQLWPKHLDREWATTLHLRRGLEAIVVFDRWPTSRKDVSERLAFYPSAGGDWHLVWPKGIPSILQPSPLGLGVPIVWGDAETNIHERLRDLAPEYRFHDEYWLRPGLGMSINVLTPLMTWWAFIFAFSILARYHPADWVKTLNLDASVLAAPIEAALDEALTAVPHLVLEALWAEPVVLTR